MNSELRKKTRNAQRGPEWPGRPKYRMSRRAPEEFARKAEEAKHRSSEAKRSAFVLRRRTKQILSEAGPAASSFATFLTARKVLFL